MALPTRVLQILESGEVPKAKIVEGAGRNEQYVALSYCWGKAETHHGLKTTTANLLIHKEGIDFESLFQTLRDAVQIAKGLGFRFLWIDALCIVQDDDDDWNREAAMMCQVYSNAALTLIASGSSCSSEGVFRYQDYSRARTVGYKDSFVHVRPDLSRDHSNSYNLDYDDEPFSARAWTLQKAVLSNRALLFTQRELKWLCNEWRKCECASLCSRLDTEDAGDPRAFRLRSLFEQQDLDEAYRKWQNIVEMFSRRQLSFDSDRLTALSGLAHRFADMLQDCFDRPDTYRAGLWEGHLPAALLWETGEDRDFQSVDLKRLTRRPRSWRAPTWSWASLEAPVLYPPFIGLAYKVKVAACSTTTRTGDPYGQILHGALTLVGTVLHGLSMDTILPERQSDAGLPRWHSDGLIGSTMSFRRGHTHKLRMYDLDLCYITHDCDTDLLRDIDSLIAVIVGHQKIADEHLLLILRKIANGGGAFERLGLAIFRPNESHHRPAISGFIDNSPTEEIVVV